MLRANTLEKIRDFNNDIGVQELRDIILTNRNKDNNVVFNFEHDFNIDVFHRAIEELDKEGLITENVIEDGEDCIYLYSREDRTFQGAVKYEIEQDYHLVDWYELERIRLCKIDEVGELNIKLQEIVNKGKVVSYLEKPLLQGLYTTRPNAQEGDLKEAFALLVKILKNTYGIMIKIPIQQKQYTN